MKIKIFFPLFIFNFFLFLKMFLLMKINDNKIINSYKNYKVKNLSIDILDQRKWHKTFIERYWRKKEFS